MRIALGILALTASPLFVRPVQAQTAADERSAAVSLTVPSGAPLRLYLTRRVSKRIDAPVEAKLMEPVYTFDREVIPAGTVALGKVSRTQPVTKWQRFRAILNGDFTPLRNAQVEFTTLELPDRHQLATHTVGNMGLNSIYIAPSTKKKKTQKDKKAPPQNPNLEGFDSHATALPPAPSVASAQTAAEQVEHYWAALLRDVPFIEYPTNALVMQAVADLNKLSFGNSASNYEFPFPVTPQNLFRGQFVPGDSNVQGPYVSQFMLQPTSLGAQPLSQQYRTFLTAGGGGADFMISVDEYQLVQNGGSSGRELSLDPSFRFIRNGRDLAAYTYVDVLYQAYLIAALVLNEIRTPPNPGSPYIGSNTEKAFGTLGAPDIAGTLPEMALRALKAAWFHKWIIDLRLRPEEYGALVQANLTKSAPVPQAATALHADVLNSAVLPLIHSIYGSYLLPQAFPEGCPTHPCYPTGHGTVGGACITALKFFFDGAQKIRPLLNSTGREVMEPDTGGLSLNPYTGTDRDGLDVNGELNKLAHNISFGHGIHAGIHFRSSTYWSILLGEQVALSILRDRAKSYNEPFRTTITKFDGSTATITNL